MIALNREVETQSLKKLSLKSVRRAREIFSPVHGQFPQPDPERLINSFACNVHFFFSKFLRIFMCIDDFFFLSVFVLVSQQKNSALP